MKIWRPYTQMLGSQPAHHVSHAEGSFIHLKNGRKILDGISSWWVITHGHCHGPLAQAIASQAYGLDQVVAANFTHDPAEKLIDLLKDFLPPELSCAFFSDNGSTAVEVAMKMAYQYCHQKGLKKKHKFLAFKHSYHGDTVGAMSVSAEGNFTRPYKDLRLDVICCKQGHYSFDDLEMWTRDFKDSLEDHHDETVAVILEPLIQGAGGMIVWPIKAVEDIALLCRQYDVLFIFDEVMTGFGRTGSVFAFEQVGVVPDFVCLSKGLTGGILPLALTLTTDKIYDAFLSTDSAKMFFHGHSFTANAISCQAAVANLEVFKGSAVLEKIKKINQAHTLSIEKINSQISLKDSRVIGAIGVIELSHQNEYQSEFSHWIIQYCLSRNLFIRPLGNVVYLMPPYCTSQDEIIKAWEIITDAIKESSKSSQPSHDEFNRL